MTDAGPVANSRRGLRPFGEFGLHTTNRPHTKNRINKRTTTNHHGKAVDIPPNVGQPAAKRCIYWLHTHTPDGIIHIEAPKDRSFVLGDFFQVWGQPLGRSSVASVRVTKRETLRAWVDGKPYKGDPRKIPLTAHADIVIQAGPPFITPPKFTTWGTL